MRRFLSVIMLLIGLMTGMMSVAQDAPAEDDNECYTGGLLEGQCISDWHWECGWYVRNHRDTGEIIPEWCGYARLPAYPSAYCARPGNGNYYVNFDGGWWLAAMVQIYFDAACEDMIQAQVGNNYIYAPPPYNAEALCKEAFGPTFNVIPSPNTNIYDCRD